MRKKSEDTVEMPVVELQRREIAFYLLGTSPLIYNAVSLKSKHQLLIPPPKKTAADKVANLKHDPPQEFFYSTYRHRENDRPTRLFFPGGGFKAAMKQAALRMPGLKKTEIAQFTWVQERDVDIYGVPEIFLAQVRSADIARTPDIRTRAALKNWAAKLTVRYVIPQLNKNSVMNLVGAAGLLCGIGDGRQEKGYGNGQWEVVNEDDERFLNIVNAGGREVQDRALQNPQPYDIESEELLSIFENEIAKRGDSIQRAA